RSFPCHICGKIFPVKHQFIGHLNTHMNRKPFCCEFCEKSFAYSTNLSRHRKTYSQQIAHSTSRGFVCSYCKRVFFAKQDLDGHMNAQHFNVKPFKCLECPKSFAYEKTLKCH
ncbi:hypothetical protein EGW08_000457, partial [Elysia chlorotica]